MGRHEKTQVQVTFSLSSPSSSPSPSPSPSPSSIFLMFDNVRDFKQLLWLRQRVRYKTIAFFTDNILHLHYNETEHEREAISGKNDKIARNCLVSTLHCIVMQMSKVICEKGYSPFSRGGHVKSQENKSFFFCPSKLVFKFFTARLDG